MAKCNTMNAVSFVLKYKRNIIDFLLLILEAMFQRDKWQLYVLELESRLQWHRDVIRSLLGK